MRSRRVWLFATRAGAVRACVALSAALGYPLTPVVVNVGGGRHAAPRRIALYCRPRAITTGPLAGQFAMVIRVDDAQATGEVAAIRALLSTSLVVPATYDGVAVPGGAGSWLFRLVDSVAPGADHDGEESDP